MLILRLIEFRVAAYLKAHKTLEKICGQFKSTIKPNFSSASKSLTTISKGMGDEENLNIVKKSIDSYPDFPKPGVLFRDIFSLMRNPEALGALNSLILEHIKKITPKPDVVIGLEARGFLLGPLITLQTGIPFVPIRKKGKLPGHVQQQSYGLEYGTDTIEIQSESIRRGQNIIIVDDLLATGGTLQAACQLVTQLGGHINQCIVVMELLELKGRETITIPVHSIVQY